MKVKDLIKKLLEYDMNEEISITIEIDTKESEKTTEKISLRAVKWKNGYRGGVSVFDKGKYMWSSRSKTIRMNEEDAKEDARQIYNNDCSKMREKMKLKR